MVLALSKELKKPGSQRQEIAAVVALLKTCARNKDLGTGVTVHADILKRGLLDNHLFVCGTLVSMYARCGALAKAREVLEGLSIRSVILWNVIIAAYVHQACNKEALESFELMHQEGLYPDAVTFSCILKACSNLRALEKGEKIHFEIVRQGLLGDDVVLGNVLVDMYVKCGALVKAKEVLRALPIRDVVSWNAVIAGYVQAGHMEEAMSCLEEMQAEHHCPDAVTFACILKACGSTGALDKGKMVHHEIVRQGLLSENVVLGNVLVDMYVKCGVLTTAKELLEGLPIRNVVSWTTLIAGYIQGAQESEALKCFESMQSDGLSPDRITFASILKACGCIGALDMGERLHLEIIRRKLTGGDAVVGGALVDMYAKCGALTKAVKVLEGLPVRDVVSWNALITGCAQRNCGKEALNCFEWMQVEGFLPDAVTLTSILRACGNMGALEEGESIHCILVRQRRLWGSFVVGNAVVDMYAKCGALTKAKEMLWALPIHDVVCWNSLITKYAQVEQEREALNCFEEMLWEGLSPNTVTLTSILKIYGSIGALEKGAKLHYAIVTSGLLDGNAFLGNALMNMYAKCGAFVKAKEVLEWLPLRHVSSWNVLIAGCAKEEHVEEALNCFQWMECEGHSPDTVTFACLLKVCGYLGALAKGAGLHSEIVRLGLLGKSTVLGNALIDMYAKCCAFMIAKELLEELPFRDVVSWNALIGRYAEEHGNEALNCFDRMQHEGVCLDKVTFACTLKACGNIKAIDKGEKIHQEIVKRESLLRDVVVAGALVDMYVKCGALAKATEVFDGLPVRNVVIWSVLIAGYAEGEFGKRALCLYEQMQAEGHSPDSVTFTCALKACGGLGALDKGRGLHVDIFTQGFLTGNAGLGNSLVDMYVKCGALAKAKEILGRQIRDVVSWNILIAGYVLAEKGKEALKCFDWMQCENLLPDQVTYACILRACGNTGALGKGEEIHSEIVQRGLLGGNLLLASALIDMYGKCDVLAKAEDFFEGLTIRDVVCWNTLISGYVEGERTVNALNCFEQMQYEGLLPDEFTFLCVLNACIHSGLLDEGQSYFMRMTKHYGITPNFEHYTCMINLFGQVGILLDNAAAGTSESLFSTHPSICLSLLNACEKLGNVKLGRWAFEHALKLDPKAAAAYVYISSIYAAAGMEDEANGVKSLRLQNETSQSHTKFCKVKIDHDKEIHSPTVQIMS